MGGGQHSPTYTHVLTANTANPALLQVDTGTRRRRLLSSVAQRSLSQYPLAGQLPRGYGEGAAPRLLANDTNSTILQDGMLELDINGTVPLSEIYLMAK